jgi:hypothetical protein
LGSLEIHRGFTAANRTHNNLIQIRIGPPPCDWSSRGNRSRASLRLQPKRS